MSIDYIVQLRSPDEDLEDMSDTVINQGPLWSTILDNYTPKVPTAVIIQDRNRREEQERDRRPYAPIPQPPELDRPFENTYGEQKKDGGDSIERGVYIIDL